MAAYSYAYTTQPLEPQYTFAPGDFASLAQYAAQQPDTNTTPYRVAPILATYATAAQRTRAVTGALLQDRSQYEAGKVVGSTTRYYPYGIGGIGIVTSPMQSAAQASVGTYNDWHAVAVLRQGPTVWIYDPSYVIGSQTRLPMIPGTSNVTRLLNSTGFGTIDQIQVSGAGSDLPNCMGRSAQWVDNVIRAPTAVSPYPASYFVPGQVASGWQVVQRY